MNQMISVQDIVIFEEKVTAGRVGDDDGGAVMAPGCSVTVILLTEAEMSPVPSLSHAPVVDQPEVDVDLVGAGPPSIENAFSQQHCIFGINRRL